MSDFTIIETQEQLDAVIGNRIRREKETQAKKYSGYISPKDYETKEKDFEQKMKELNDKLEEANEKITALNQIMAEKDEQLKAYESHSVKTRIARQYGLPEDAVEFLHGEDEASLMKSAESLRVLIGSRHVYTLEVPNLIIGDDRVLYTGAYEKGQRYVNAEITTITEDAHGEQKNTIWKAVRLF